MPRTGLYSEGGIEIRLSETGGPFKPGDLIHGCVALKNGAPRPATVQLEFFGRAKSKFWVAHGRSKRIVRGRVPLLQTRVDLTSDGTSWPFSLSIPTHSLDLSKERQQRLLGSAAEGFPPEDDCEWPSDSYFLSSLDGQGSAPLPSVTYFKE